jgi:uncharacterized protein (TIGR02118 family)
VTLVGNGLEAAIGWWWLDPVGALALGAGALVMSWILGRSELSPRTTPLPAVSLGEPITARPRGDLVSTRIVALWHKPNDVEGFEQHYASTHLPLARALPGLQEAVTSKALDGVYYRVATLVFENADALGSAFGSEQAQKLLADTEHMQKTFGATVDILTLEDD